MQQYNNNKSQIRLPLFIALGVAAGVLIGASFSNNSAPAVIQKDLSKNVQKLREVLTLIDRNYVDEVDTEKLVEDAIVHMLSELDPHSSYISAEQVVQANESLQGNFEGIGVEFNIFRDTIVVVAPLSGGPSEALGIQAGDKIIAVDDENVAGVGFTNNDVRNALKGEKGTKVKVTIKRKGRKEPIDFEIIRDRIPTYSVDASYMIDQEKGYIKISRFSATTYEEFKQALEDLKSKGMTKLVLDLQGNPGGYMYQAIDIVDEFLPKKKKILYTKGKQVRYNDDLFADRDGLFEKGDLIVLVNEGSASASEIVSGALQDNDRALIVGRRTFGKGLVQTALPLSDGSEMRLTISRYYTPSGRSIQVPYDEGAEEYYNSMYERFENGEFFSADSIHFNDSLKYSTTSGRTVYGGGGIMPDYFVPLDTTQNSLYLSRLINSNSTQEYTFNYAASNKEELERMSYEQFYSNFEVTDKMLNELAEIGKENGVKIDRDELQKHKELFQLYVKAQIARQIWDSSAYIHILNETNEVLQNALKLFDKADKLDRSNL